ncbi:hypothetical protein CHCC20441_0297 [Bacillus licheniformis]|uniref:Uncharacterized protein n=1 Tax=Bacillus licheniformis TaxID=1402 RepID=A0A8B5YCA7_BACLI|nr:hypothetical protein B4092_0473 [Bacillus licheniformis]TWN08692.1 hypothetical protein CHCC14564_2424 [Bacillus licheniformis LMG 17339]KYC77378.1 hypothetical protein B4090_0595 [Bacillus licheniformis]KYC79561.1 hypothetical protein B4091_0527 [Bacillus licheniformis]KYC94250.1 hypothetical protein B4164_0599 [Bacillus licheniformis]
MIHLMNPCFLIGIQRVKLYEKGGMAKCHGQWKTILLH